MKNFEMAHADIPEEIVEATKNALISALQGVVADFKKDMSGPGMTWEQIEFLLDTFKKKEPKIYYQEHET